MRDNGSVAIFVSRFGHGKHFRTVQNKQPDSRNRNTKIIGYTLSTALISLLSFFFSRITQNRFCALNCDFILKYGIQYLKNQRVPVPLSDWAKFYCFRLCYYTQQGIQNMYSNVSFF